MQAVWGETFAYCQEPHTNRFDLRSEAYIQAWLEHDFERPCMRQWISSSNLYNTPTSAVSQGIYQTVGLLNPHKIQCVRLSRVLGSTLDLFEN